MITLEFMILNNSQYVSFFFSLSPPRMDIHNEVVGKRLSLSSDTTFDAYAASTNDRGNDVNKKYLPFYTVLSAGSQLGVISDYFTER